MGAWADVPAAPVDDPAGAAGLIWIEDAVTLPSVFCVPWAETCDPTATLVMVPAVLSSTCVEGEYSTIFELPSRLCTVMLVSSFESTVPVTSPPVPPAKRPPAAPVRAPVRPLAPRPKLDLSLLVSCLMPA